MTTITLYSVIYSRIIVFFLHIFIVRTILNHHEAIKQSKLHGNVKPLVKLLERNLDFKIKPINQVKKKIKGSVIFNEIKSIN